MRSPHFFSNKERSVPQQNHSNTVLELNCELLKAVNFNKLRGQTLVETPVCGCFGVHQSSKWL